MSLSAADLGHDILFMEILSVLFKTSLPTNRLSFEIWTFFFFFLHILHLKANNKMFFCIKKCGLFCFRLLKVCLVV